MTTEEKQPTKAKPKIHEFGPKIKLCDVGDLFTNTMDLYPTDDKWGLITGEDEWHGMGGTANVFRQGSNLMILEQVQFYMNGKANVRLHVLNGDKDGWITIASISRAKEWEWMIPIKRNKVVKELFNSSFTKLKS